jgi:hypothetical protein
LDGVAATVHERATGDDAAVAAHLINATAARAHSVKHAIQHEVIIHTRELQSVIVLTGTDVLDT